MADVISDGKIKIAWATSIANINAPTAAELTAAQDFTLRVTPDGLNISPETADVDNSNIASTFSTNRAGRRGFTVEVTFKRGTTPSDDLPYTTLSYGTVGFLVVRRILAYTTAFAAAQTVEVFPIECGEPQMIPPAPNEVSKFMSPMKVTDEPNTRATVA